MFNIQNYITPIILSHVDKYINNLKVEDSEISLWDGDATFHNLDLRLDILQKEFQLPFNLVSGHIHELLIHVPWTKINSEPIKITINTIECVLKLPDRQGTNAEGAGVAREAIRKPNTQKKETREALPGYIQTIINRIVNNICVNCNNLILKYVEEDIVVSVNIKLLTFQSANGNWKPDFIDQANVPRKLITLSDMTVCLDKRNAAGKIEIYQDPVLYRCFVEMRLFRDDDSENGRNSPTTRLDVHCQKMEFSMTEQQIPMLMRLMMLLYALQQRQIKSEAPRPNEASDSENVPQTTTEGWVDWAYNMSTYLFTGDTSEEDDTAVNLVLSNHIFHTGFYVDHVKFTFKLSEYSSDKAFYGSRKHKYHPILNLLLNECFFDTVTYGIKAFNAQVGVSEALLIPKGCCTCGFHEVTDLVHPDHYFLSGSLKNLYKNNTLFDPFGPENMNKKKKYNVPVDFECLTSMLQKSPAIAMDYFYSCKLPEDFTYEQFHELQGDFEYSNLQEHATCHLTIGPFTLRICSGLLHRMSTLQQIAATYDYTPYYNDPVEPVEVTEIPEFSEDEQEALSLYIPKRLYQFTFLKPVFQFQLMDHPGFTPSRDHLFRKRKKAIGASKFVPMSNFLYPIVTCECGSIDIKIRMPMYPRRLIYTACLTHSPSDSMFDACYTHCNLRIIGLSSKLLFGKKHTTILMPSNITCGYKNILKPQYWPKSTTVHQQITANLDCITVIATKAEIMILLQVFHKFIECDAGELKNSIYATSLLPDASKNTGMVVLEISLENLNWSYIETLHTISQNFKVASLKSFVLDPHPMDKDKQADTKLKEPHQVLILSGPERNIEERCTCEEILLNILLQYNKKGQNDKDVDPQLFLFDVGQIKIFFDPLVFRWLLYSPRTVQVRSESGKNQVDLIVKKQRALPESSASYPEATKRTVTPHESVHSSSDREHNVYKLTSISGASMDDQNTDNNLYIYDLLLSWHPFWTEMILNGSIAQCTVYFPTQSLSAIGSQGIQDAVEIALKRSPPPDMLVVTLPDITVYSNGQKRHLAEFPKTIPVVWSERMQRENKQKFPWTLSIKNLCCYTLQNNSKLCFLKSVSGNATVGMTVKTREVENTQKHKSATSEESVEEVEQVLSMLSICVHIDNSPIIIAMSEAQVCMMTSIINGLLDVTFKIMPELASDKPKPVEPVILPTLPSKSQSHSQSPTFFKESTFDSVSDKTGPAEEDSEDDKNLKLTAWVQWTIAKLSIKVYGYDLEATNSLHSSYSLPPTLKLVFDMEDIMSSLDLQKVYLKFKCKVGTASILHYEREQNKSWEQGPYLGIVMRSREELIPTERQDSSDFMTITFTRAKCGHVYNKWGTAQKNKLSDTKPEHNLAMKNITTRYISEVVINLQPIDFVLSFHTLRNYYLVLEPFINIPKDESKDCKVKSSRNYLTYINNECLPLAYLECHGVRVVLPVSDINGCESFHDACILEIDNISFVPMAENPICRTPIRPDIYQQAAQTRILNIPGSEVEDRQYQFNINSLSINTGSWSEFSQLLSREISIVSSLHTMNENPALEWNNLGGRMGIMPHLTLLPIMKKFDLCVVAAPAIIYKNSTLVCGNSVEFNLVSDIDVNINLHQIRLAVSLLQDYMRMVEALPSNVSDRRPKFENLYPVYVVGESNEDLEQIKDSGIETVDGTSENTTRTIENAFSPDIERRTAIKLYSDRSSDKSQIYKRSLLLPSQDSLNYFPIDVLLTGGQISLSLYEIINPNIDSKYLQKLSKSKKGNTINVVKEDSGYEASEEGSVDECIQKVFPLIYGFLSQPNAYFSWNAYDSKMHISCFDIGVRIRQLNCASVQGIPTQANYPTKLLETKPGIPNPDTGIPPSFYTFKWIKNIAKPPTLEINFDRPIKIQYSSPHWIFLLSVIDKINEQGNYKQLQRSRGPNIIDKSVELSKYKVIKQSFWGISTLDVRFSQLFFAVQSEDNLRMVLSIGGIHNHLFFRTRPDRIINRTNVQNVTVTTGMEDALNILLNPWSFTVDVSLLWESWQRLNDNPRLKVSGTSDCIVVNFGSDQLKCIEAAQKELSGLVSYFQSDATEASVKPPTQIHEKDQHYKDDLRAGAFQFVNACGSPDDLPLPYQVIFWNETVNAMAWRYPQPRVLTKVVVFPVPFKAFEKSEGNQVVCHLEYWSDCHRNYQSYTSFQLSESDISHLDLPRNSPQPAVSAIWRVIINSCDDNADILVAPRALAACMRIDSYFNCLLIPTLQVAFKLSTISLSLYNQFNANDPVVMPSFISEYMPDGLVPNNQCFATLSIENSNIYVASWNYHNAMLDFVGSLKCKVLDYGSLIEKPILSPFKLKFTLSMADSISLSIISNPLHLKFSPAIGHTIAVSSQLWNQSWKPRNINEPPEMIIITRYVICNNSNIKIKLGQVNSDEEIILPSKFVHFYCWRSQKLKNLMRVAIEDNNWTWSKPFGIDSIKTFQLPVDNKISLIVSIKSISATQKQITFYGQLTVCNMLLEHFEMKVMPAKIENKDAYFRSAPTYLIGGKSATPSFAVSLETKMVVRLRFYGLQSFWSGDIPLEEITRGIQPWLVKVPLQERGQFLSIWCQILPEKTDKYKRYLVMLWPLFMVKSNLPSQSMVVVKTPLLNVNLEAAINSCGEIQQIYCPGTLENDHEISFIVDENNPDLNLQVALNYKAASQQNLFKIIDNGNYDEIMNFLRTYDDTKWPYVTSELDRFDWFIEESPRGHVLVRFSSACLYSNALLLEVSPWCMMLNKLGCPVSVSCNNVVLCHIRHYGIGTPPKFEDTFTLNVHIGNSLFASPILQFSRPDWTKNFYMPRINGIIPPNENIRVPVKCGSMLCTISLMNNTLNEMRVLQIASSHVITNHTGLQLQVACLAVPKNGKVYEVVAELNNCSFTVHPSMDKSNAGIPILQWYAIEDIGDSFTDFTLHIMVAYDKNCDWSCPVNVDKSSTRTSISIDNDTQNIPLLVITQEYKGQFYLSIHHDNHPQLLVSNKCSVALYCAEKDTNGKIIPDNNCFKWLRCINPHSEVHYTMPCISNMFPEINQNFIEGIAFSVDPEDPLMRHQWSQSVDINNYNEHYLKIPFHDDVRLTIKKINYTIKISIESITELEISAQDIRHRLTLHETHTTNIVPKPTIRNSESEVQQAEIDYNLLLSQSSSESLYLSSKSFTSFLNSSSSNFQALLPPLSESDCDKIDKKYAAFHEFPKDINQDFKLTAAVFIESLTITMGDDCGNCSCQLREIGALSLDNIGFTLGKNEAMECCLSMLNVQFDNQMFFHGGFDFPVVFIGQKPSRNYKLETLNVPALNLIRMSREKALLNVNMMVENWSDVITNKSMTEMKEIKIRFQPFSAYVEDVYVTKLTDYLKKITPTQLIHWQTQQKPKQPNVNSNLVKIPDDIIWESIILAKPLALQTLQIEPLSILLSIHSSMKLYIALDCSPLQFSHFERKNLLTTPYRLGHAVTMHYLSGAIFRAGWVVGSLELLGSPGGLARTLGTGLRDFISLPYHGLIQGPWAFLIGVTHGSASLMRHITAGTLQSVTKLADSVARNLDRLSLDQEHLQRVAEYRSNRPQGLTEGFIQGLTSLGISLLGAVGGIAHHPLQSMFNEGASPRGFAAGLGLGLVGMVTKPLSGAAELVAKTGQGLLQGAGWNQLPQAKMNPISFQDITSESMLKYRWKFIKFIKTNLLVGVEAVCISEKGGHEDVTILLSLDQLVIVDSETDELKRIIKLNEISRIEIDDDPTLLQFIFAPAEIVPGSDPGVIEMDPACRARVADYVRTSGLHLTSRASSPERREMNISPDTSPPPTPVKHHVEQANLTFYVNPQIKSYFSSMFVIAKQQSKDNTFQIL